MRFILRRWYVFLGLLLAFVSLADNSPVYTDPATTITVSSDSPTFTIKQPANPTTGYSWTAKSYDNNLLKLIAVDYRASSPTAQMPGSSGNEIFVFQAQPKAFGQNTKTQITLLYSRSFAPQDNPKTVVFNVVLK